MDPPKLNTHRKSKIQNPNMSVEIEKKYILSDEQMTSVLAGLEEIGATYSGEDFEENIIFRGGSITRKGAVLRIRKVGQLTILTYKLGVKDDQGIKHQIEYETAVADAFEIEKIIESLGFERSLVYEKRRRKWRFRDVEIALDQLPFGQYMEIEGPAEAIIEAELLLNAEDFPVESQTYPALTQMFGVRNQQVIEARFPLQEE